MIYSIINYQRWILFEKHLGLIIGDSLHNYYRIILITKIDVRVLLARFCTYNILVHDLRCVHWMCLTTLCILVEVWSLIYKRLQTTLHSVNNTIDELYAVYYAHNRNWYNVANRFCVSYLKPRCVLALRACHWFSKNKHNQLAIKKKWFVFPTLVLV